jgi:hypothetical protein
MPARLAVPKTPQQPSVPRALPLYKSRALLTRPESTLLQVLIPLHFNSPTINTYKKPGGGSPPRTRKVLQLVTPDSQPNLLPTFSPELSTLRLFFLSSLRAVNESNAQPTENKAASNPALSNVDAASSISPLFATLTKNTRGVGGTESSVAVRKGVVTSEKNPNNQKLNFSPSCMMRGSRVEVTLSNKLEV